MKRFLLIVLPVLFMVVCLGLSSGDVRGVFLGETNKIKASKSEITYAESDLGFVVENFEAKNLLKYTSKGEVVGECLMVFGGKQKMNELAQKMGLVILNKYEVENKSVVEGVSTLLSYRIKGRRANVQMVADGEKIVIGTPIIYGSY
ncbi:MAG: hypothetical protein IKC11_06290 [Clostridia bacterium]|nr:hypothetical protein [Clostridia bacterium]